MSILKFGFFSHKLILGKGNSKHLTFSFNFWTIFSIFIQSAKCNIKPCLSKSLLSDFCHKNKDVRVQNNVSKFQKNNTLKSCVHIDYWILKESKWPWVEHSDNYVEDKKIKKSWCGLDEGSYQLSFLTCDDSFPNAFLNIWYLQRSSVIFCSDLIFEGILILNLLF